LVTSVYEPAGNVGDPLAIELNEIARANGMDACVFLRVPSKGGELVRQGDGPQSLPPRQDA
jgi:hypothetical protein